MKKPKQKWQKKRIEDITSVMTHLHTVAKKSANQIHRKDAQATCDFYVRNGFIPHHMKMRAIELIKLSFTIDPLEAKKGERRWCKHYLYAISNGEYLKIGYSINPASRIKTLKTSSPTELKIVWQTLCGYNDLHARKQEKKLHRALSAHRIDGEWFKFDCLYTCRQWRIKAIDGYYDDYMNNMEITNPEKFSDLVNAQLDREALVNL